MGLPLLPGWACAALLRALEGACRKLWSPWAAAWGCPSRVSWASGLRLSRCALEAGRLGVAARRHARPPAVTTETSACPPRRDVAPYKPTSLGVVSLIAAAFFAARWHCWVSASHAVVISRSSAALRIEQLVAPNNALDAYTSSCQAAVQNRCAKRTVASCRHALVRSKQAPSTHTSGPRCRRASKARSDASCSRASPS